MYGTIMIYCNIYCNMLTMLNFNHEIDSLADTQFDNLSHSLILPVWLTN